MKKIKIFVQWKIFVCIGGLLLGLGALNGCGNTVSGTVTEEGEEVSSDDFYGEDYRLRLTDHKTYAYDDVRELAGDNLYSQYTRISYRYNEEEKAKLSHAYFDEQDRMLYILGYSSSILGDSRSYCEENIYQWDDEENRCRYIYYKSNSMPYEDGFYVAIRYMFEASDFLFDEEGRLLSNLCYRRNVGSDPNGYSEELFFSRGYQAEYDGKDLMSELQYYDFWGTNEAGAWEYRIYQYNEEGDYTLRVAITEDEIMYCRYEYDKEAAQVEEYIYQVTDDWEFSCDDGSTYYISPHWGNAAVKKVAADGTVEKELYYGRAMDLGQQHYLMPEEVEETLDDHTYTVNPGDCLWSISHKIYGRGAYYDLLYRLNRSVIGYDKELLLPGMRLYIPEVGNAQDTKIAR